MDIKSFLAKPLIEDYEGKQIFYIEAIPVPFVGKIGFAYTFVDNFFFIGLNRTSMKHVIDVAKTGDTAKRELIDNSTSSQGSFFLTLFDGKTASDDLKGLYEKNRTAIPRYAALLDKNILSGGSDSLTPAISTYYVGSIRDKRLGNEVKPIDYALGGFRVFEKDGMMRVRIDESTHGILSGTTLQLWQNMLSEERFPKDIISEKGITVESFLASPMKTEILSLELIVQLDRAFSGSEMLLRNSTFSLGMGDNEVGFRTRVFREKEVVKPTAL
jgi:hypothetical protein